MTTTNAKLFRSNLPAFELFTAHGPTQKMGVAWKNATVPGALNVILGARGDSQKRYLLCPTEALGTVEPGSSVPVGHLFDTTTGPTDFQTAVGVAFLDADGTYRLQLDPPDGERRLKMSRWVSAAPLAPAQL